MQNIKKKKKWIAYVLWLFGGFCGLHHFYLGRDLHAFAVWCTFGGGLGLAWIRDLWRIPEYVNDANENEDYMKKLIEDMQKMDKPSFSTARFFGQTFVAMFLGLIYFWSIPVENIYDDWDLQFLRYLTPIPISIGVWIVGNIGRQQGRLKPCLVSASISFALSHSTMPGNIFWCCISTSIAFNSKSKEWRRTPTPKRSFFRRMLILGLAGLVYASLACSGLYFNAEVVDSASLEKTKFRDAFVNWLNSPIWEDVKERIIININHYKVHGWWKIYQDLMDTMDPFGESRALKVLGLPQSATKPEIIAKFRTLSKEWHPDRHKDNHKKQEAHLKFMEYQEAYQKLIKTRGKIKAATAPDAQQPI